MAHDILQSAPLKLWDRSYANRLVFSMNYVQIFRGHLLSSFDCLPGVSTPISHRHLPPFTMCTYGDNVQMKPLILWNSDGWLKKGNSQPKWFRKRTDLFHCTIVLSQSCVHNQRIFAFSIHVGEAIDTISIVTLNWEMFN